MNVYVESNFVLEYALQQEEFDACAEIIRLASNNRLNLLVPAFSLAEPHQAIAGKDKVRTRLGNELRTHIGELGRSRPHRHIPATFDALATALATRAQFERDGLREAVLGLLQNAEIIPLDAAILSSATAIEIDYDLSGQDSIVLASVLTHLEATTPTESCFLNRNTKDFDDPDIRERLEGLRCRFFAKFEPALAYIAARISRPSAE